MRQALDRMQARLFTSVMSLPPPVLRRLVVRPLRRDGMTLSPQTQLALRLKRAAFVPAVEDLSFPKARKEIRRQSLLVGGQQPIGATHDLRLPVAEGEQRARIYVPRGLVGAEPGPMLVWFHGGGMVYGDIETYEQVCRFLAEQAGVRVLSVEYRLAPEHRFPAGVDDACAAYEYVAKNAAQLGADPDRLAVGGDSAGAYLSAAVALDAAQRGLPLRFQLLIYPVTDHAAQTPSRQLFNSGLFLTQRFMDQARDAYLREEELRDPRASVLFAEVPDGLAPAFVATAGFDPLRDEGEAYARKLEEAGVPVRQKRYGGEIHGFANMVGVPGTPRDAMTEMAQAVSAALSAE